MKDKWTITKPVELVIAGAKKRKDHHAARREHYKQELDRIKEDIKNHGMSLEVSVNAFGTSNANFFNLDGDLPNREVVEMVINKDMQKQVNEICQKMNKHGQLVVVYAKWIDFLNQAEGNVALDFEDYEFFFKES